MTSDPASGGDRGKGFLGRVAGAVTERVVETVDPDIVLEHVDLDALLKRVDLNAVLARIDLNQLVDSLDIDAIVQGLDINAVMDRVDLDALLRTVDLEALVRRSGIPDIVAESTYSMAGSALDLARRQLVGLDVLIDRAVDRMLRRSKSQRRIGPPRLMEGGP